MQIDNYFAYVVIAFFTITSPGAAILLAINNAMIFDLKAVFFSTIGNILGLFILSSMAMLLVGSLLKSFNGALESLKIVGALYLIYLGVKQIKNRHLKLHLKNESYKRIVNGYRSIFIKGFLVAITNPKPILFFSAIFPLFIQKEYSIVGQFFILTGTFLFISFCSLMFYGYISQKMKAWFFDEKRLLIFYKISGSLFVLMGVAMMLL